MEFIWTAIEEWVKSILVGGIVNALAGMFDSVNNQVADISGQIALTPQGWNASIFNMIRSLSFSPSPEPFWPLS